MSCNFRLCRIPLRDAVAESAGSVPRQPHIGREQARLVEQAQSRPMQKLGAVRGMGTCDQRHAAVVRLYQCHGFGAVPDLVTQDNLRRQRPCCDFHSQRPGISHQHIKTQPRIVRTIAQLGTAVYQHRPQRGRR